MSAVEVLDRLERKAVADTAVNRRQLFLLYLPLRRPPDRRLRARSRYPLRPLRDGLAKRSRREPVGYEVALSSIVRFPVSSPTPSCACAPILTLGLSMIAVVRPSSRPSSSLGSKRSSWTCSQNPAAIPERLRQQILKSQPKRADYARSLLLWCPGHKPRVNLDGAGADQAVGEL